MNPSVSYCAQSGENFFCRSFFFLKLLEQNGEGNKENDRFKQKLTRLGGKNKLVKENAAASVEPINFRERMIMEITEIGHVSLSPLVNSDILMSIEIICD